ncbi:MAG: IS1595 family transposase [Dehalococcoidia bacterium]|nr:IS1595 family transposase [Dehalococcoidia bacterium]
MPRPPFPKTLRQFQADFASEEACQQYLAACRWPDGFICPRCGHRRAYELVNQRRQQCAGCRHQVSVTAGTVLHQTKLPLTQWFWAAYLMTTDKRGVSALLVQRQLGLSCYETAWMMLHKLRRAMVNAIREPLHGEVEVDETWIGGEQAGLRGSRQLKGRRAALVLVAVERRGNATGRVRRRVIPDFKAKTIIPFLTQNVSPGSTIYTDGLKSFEGLQEAGFKHIARAQPLRSELRKGAKSAVPLADRAIGNLQQWLIGTYHGVSRAQLQVYLDEFVFRHNRRKHPAAAFQTLLGLGTGRKSTEYQRIRAAKDLTDGS